MERPISVVSMILVLGLNSCVLGAALQINTKDAFPYKSTAVSKGKNSIIRLPVLSSRRNTAILINEPTDLKNPAEKHITELTLIEKVEWPAKKILLRKQRFRPPISKITSYLSSTSNIEQDPISINSNSDFATRAAAEGWPGNGSRANLYVIDGFNAPIAIRNTDVYFRITNSKITEGYWGIALTNVTNGEILNNRLANNYGGIRLSSATNNSVSNNTIINNNDGIWLDYAANNSISNNNISSNYWNGILLFRSADNSISNNTFANNIHNGLWLHFLANSSISYNTITDNGENGIWLTCGDNASISYNTIANNIQYGICIWGSANTMVQQNDFINNHPGDSQGYDDGPNNVFICNYWNDWTSPDNDGDGIVDNPYTVAGTANNEDSFPLTAPVMNPTSGPASSTPSKSEGSPGFTIGVLMISVAAFFLGCGRVHRKTRNQ